jgi:hypothetical protein
VAAPFSGGLKLLLVEAVEIRGAASFAVCAKGASLIFFAIRLLRFSIDCAETVLQGKSKPAHPLLKSAKDAAP